MQAEETQRIGATELDMDGFQEASARILAAVESVIDGKTTAVRTALTVMLAQGHLLLEDVPGVGKTMLAKALARATGASVSRIQFTPDLLPSDVTGVSIYSQATGSFEFRPGPVFSNIVIGDEINRASAKTQSSLLECMEEAQVSVDGNTYALARPFMVLATQNPIEMEGTFPLPEAQRDRFMARISMGYPDREAEVRMLGTHHAHSPLEVLEPAVTVSELEALIRVVEDIFVSDPVKSYVVDLGQASREHPELTLGASPRSLLHVIRAAKATAALAGRSFVIPDDVAEVLPVVLTHRLVVDRRAALSGRSAAEITAHLLSRVPVETVAARRAAREGSRRVEAS